MNAGDVGRLLLSSPHLAMITTDAAGFCSHCNPAGLSLLGVADEAEIAGHPLRELLSGSDAALTHLLQPLSDGSYVESRDVSLLQSDGSTRPMIAWGGPLLQRKKRVGMLLLIGGLGDVLLHTEALFTKVFRLSPGLSAITDPDTGRHLDVNEAWLEALGYRRDEVIGKTAFELGVWARPEDRAKIVATLQRDGRLRSYEAGLRDREGRVHEAIISGEIVQINGERRLLLVGQDITEQRAVQSEIRLLSRMIQQSPVAMIITDAKGMIEYANPACERLLGYQIGEMRGNTPAMFGAGLTSQSFYREMWASISAGHEWRGELLDKNREGDLLWMNVHVSPVWDAQGNITHYLGMQEDITLHKQQEQEILYRAHYDALTGLPNRTQVMDCLSQAIEQARLNHNRVVLMYVDLDDFRKVNDTLAHAVGDQLLGMAAERFRGTLHEADTIARLGGDEFLVLLTDVEEAAEAESAARRVLQAFSQPFHLRGLEIVVTASIGLSIWPDDGSDPETLLRNADTAMYRAKDDGRNGFRFFSPSMNEHARERLDVEHRLRTALAGDDFRLVYQPIISLGSGAPVGVEALLRLDQPDSPGPDVFIPVAEQTGVIVPLGAWVLERACRQTQAWLAEGLGPLSVAVNVSPRQFQRAGLVQLIEFALSSSGLPASCLRIEVTEGLLVSRQAETRQILEQLRAMGVKIALDDFGTGYASLSYLKTFPFDILKIDRSFVQNLETDSADRAMVSAVLTMARSLGISVVAEGVENRAQLEILREAGCDNVQGYFFSRPLPAADLEDYLRQQRAAET
jgi:diguanylate cyclase (GGDEF)-like protein/PAS domain S-box-containing protein